MNTSIDVEKRIQKLMMPVETQIMMCDDINDILYLAVGMLRRAILILDNQYNPDGRKAVINEFNK
jgi:glucose uptake protein GlcU